VLSKGERLDSVHCLRRTDPIPGHDEPDVESLRQRISQPDDRRLAIRLVPSPRTRLYTLFLERPDTLPDCVGQHFGAGHGVPHARQALVIGTDDQPEGIEVVRAGETRQPQQDSAVARKPDGEHRRQ
jgi:hypothetical protein